MRRDTGRRHQGDEDAVPLDEDAVPLGVASGGAAVVPLLSVEDWEASRSRRSSASYAGVPGSA
ncbi:hypothetical protein [Streptomyces sp. NPDC048309]|uniref:hypothetical protein n=1 Tax=Streptomyces sp. NPDC048309 TaxID=3154618 RepID=UPI0033EFFD9D